MFGIEKQLAHITEIKPGLFLAGSDAVQEKKLEKRGIQYILNVASEVEYALPSQFHCLRLPLIDGHNQLIKPYLESAFNFLKQAKEAEASVLIHCRYGMSRSVAILTAWLLYQQHQENLEANADELIKDIYLKRAIIQPHENFCLQLREYAQELNAALVARNAVNVATL